MRVDEPRYGAQDVVQTNRRIVGIQEYGGNKVILQSVHCQLWHTIDYRLYLGLHKGVEESVTHSYSTVYGLWRLWSGELASIHTRIKRKIPIPPCEPGVELLEFHLIGFRGLNDWGKLFLCI